MKQYFCFLAHLMFGNYFVVGLCDSVVNAQPPNSVGSRILQNGTNSSIIWRVKILAAVLISFGPSIFNGAPEQ